MRLKPKTGEIVNHYAQQFIISIIYAIMQSRPEKTAGAEAFPPNLQRKEVRPMLVTLTLSVIIAVVILLNTLRDIEAKTKKSACDNFDEIHKR